MREQMIQEDIRVTASTNLNESLRHQERARQRDECIEELREDKKQLLIEINQMMMESEDIYG
jgi:hypothetical protein